MNEQGQTSEVQASAQRSSTASLTEFVLEKSIFSNVFDKDIRRVFIYKKAERLAKAVHLVTPAFVAAPALKDKIDAIAVGLVEGAILPPSLSREALSRELLSLSSVLAIARIGGLLSAMNSDLIAREAQELLQEVAAYEEPRLSLENSPTFAELSKAASHSHKAPVKTVVKNPIRHSIGHMSDTTPKGDRREAILSILRSKGSVYIKDISVVVRNVSEKTIQRELQALIEEGVVTKTGERRWTAYQLAAS